MSKPIKTDSSRNRDRFRHSYLDYHLEKYIDLELNSGLSDSAYSKNKEQYSSLVLGLLKVSFTLLEQEVFILKICSVRRQQMSSYLISSITKAGIKKYIFCRSLILTMKLCKS